MYERRSKESQEVNFWSREVRAMCTNPWQSTRLESGSLLGWSLKLATFQCFRLSRKRERIKDYFKHDSVGYSVLSLGFC